jgi:hypothetical protein
LRRRDQGSAQRALGRRRVAAVCTWCLIATVRVLAPFLYIPLDDIVLWSSGGHKSAGRGAFQSLPLCFGVRLVRLRGHLYVRWQGGRHKEQEGVIFVNSAPSCPVPLFTRRTGVLLYALLRKRCQLSVQPVAPRKPAKLVHFSQTRLLESSSAQVQVERLPSELRPKTRLRDITAIC